MVDPNGVPARPAAYTRPISPSGRVSPRLPGRADHPHGLRGVCGFLHTLRRQRGASYRVRPPLPTPFPGVRLRDMVRLVSAWRGRRKTLLHSHRLGHEGPSTLVETEAPRKNFTRLPIGYVPPFIGTLSASRSAGPFGNADVVNRPYGSGSAG